MDSVVQIIEDNSGWKESALIAFAKENRVEVRQKGGLILLNYEDNIPNNGWNDFNRQCRGTILDIKHRSIVAHPFDKFFNVDSHPETKYDILPFSNGYEISVKYDGSMVTAFSNENEVEFATRSSFHNFQTEMAGKIFRKSLGRLKEVDFTRYTPVFELVAPENHLIVRYDDSKMILIGVRDLQENKMLNYSWISEFAQTYGLIPPKLLEKEFSFVYDIAMTGDNHEIEEGWVVRFRNGLYVKLKTWQYLAHRQIQKQHLDKQHLIRNYCEMNTRQWTDFLNGLPPDIRNSVDHFGRRLQSKLNSFSEDMQGIFEKFSSIESQKDFALAIQKEVPRELNSFIFALRSGRSLDQLIRKKYKDILREDMFEEVVYPSMIKEWAFQKKD
ncbi:MAG: hypothetical protein D3916_10340 [Candidatus Electrothrix sp. MAN1_4]|nr:hypothetical protein [Candidatus Electrothrix sp. MAN1_4]